MVYRLRPLELSFEFEDRSYRLGETVRLTVELTPSTDVQVREGRVDLVCEQRYVQVADSAGAAAAFRGGQGPSARRQQLLVVSLDPGRDRRRGAGTRPQEAT
mgnify:CR=1 FL=1